MAHREPEYEDARSKHAAGVSLWGKARRELPGIAFCVGLAVAASAASRAVPGLSTAAVAIAAGILAGAALPREGLVQPGIRRAAGTGLELTIVLLGLTIPAGVLPAPAALAALAGVMVLTLGFSALCGRLGGLGTHAGLLAGMGSAVCGSAAIAASAPLLRVQPAVVAAALASINLLSAAGMVAIPAAAMALGVEAEVAGWWTGGSLQAVGQAVGGGFAFSDRAGEVATAVKMFRVLALVALLPALALVGGRAGRVRLPWFVWGFVGATVVSIVRGPVVEAGPVVAFLLAAALAGIGARIRPRDLLDQGPKVLALCAAAFLVQLAGVVALVASGLAS